MPELNFNALASQGPQGVFQGYMQGQQLRNQMAAQEQQRQLADLQLQNALREQRMAGEEEAAYKAAGNDMARLQTELFQRGLGKQGLAVGAQMVKQRADQLKMQKDTIELTKNAAKQVMANPQNAAQILSSFGQRYGIDMNDDLAEIQRLGNNPDAIRQWAAGVTLEADKLLPKFEKFDQGGAVVTGTVNPLTGKFEAGTAFQKSMAPGEAERIGLERQRVGLEGRRVAVLEENQRREADPAFQQRMAGAKAVGEAIAKGDVAAQQALPQIIDRAEEGVRLIDELVGKRDSKTGQLLKGEKPHPGFEGAVGQNYLAGAPYWKVVSGTDAGDFAARFDQIKGASFLEAFQALKGGGAITEKEGQKGTDAINRMSLAQSEKEFVRAAMDLQNVIRKGVANAQSRAARAGGAAPAAPAAPAAGGVKFLGFE